jgi:hypothetical protein
MFPNTDDLPSCRFELPVPKFVSHTSCLDLLLPPLHIDLWDLEVYRTSMPKTAINEYAELLPRKNDIGSTSNFSDWTNVLPKSQARFV